MKKYFKDIETGKEYCTRLGLVLNKRLEEIMSSLKDGGILNGLLEILVSPELLPLQLIDVYTSKHPEPSLYYGIKIVESCRND